VRIEQSKCIIIILYQLRIWQGFVLSVLNLNCNLLSTDQSLICDWLCILYQGIVTFPLSDLKVLMIYLIRLSRLCRSYSVTLENTRKWNGRKRLWAFRRYCHLILLVGLRKTLTILSQDSKTLGWDPNLRSLKKEVGILISQL
jgi:hypothetical protein